MTTNPIQLECSAFPDDTRVIAFRCREALGAPYEAEVWLSTATGAEVDLEDALFAPAFLSLDPADDSSAPRNPFQLRGILAGVDHVHEHGGRAIFTALIVPRLWLLGQSEHSRVFCDKSFDEILKQVVDAVGITGSDLDVQASGLPVEEHICQYRESDLDFLHRWLEREGLTYFFDHAEAAEKLVVLGAQPSTPIGGGPVRYHPRVGTEAADFMAPGHFQRLRTKRVSMPRSVALADYDYAKPKLDVRGKDDVLPRGQAEVVRFGNRFFDPDRGAALAKLRAQALRGKQEIQVAEGTVLGVRPGSVVEIEDHPRTALNQKYLVLAAEHTAVEPGADRDVIEQLIGFDQRDLYRVTSDLLATSVDYKPLQKTAWPRIHSHELGVVDGPADSDYAQLDDQGRYKVRFLFDEADAEAGKASTWVRMMQPHGGNPEGIHFPLRKGTEVVMTFLGGDPDRPVIAGAVPNAETPSQVTSGNNTRNVIRTGANNFIEMEDTKDKEWIHTSTPNKNTHIHMGEPREYEGTQAHLAESTDGNGFMFIGGNRAVHVASNFNERVDGDVTEKYSGKKSQLVGGDVVETYESGWHTHVSGARTYAVDGGTSDTLHGGWNQAIDGGWKQTIAGGWIQGVDSVIQGISGDLTQTVGGPATIMHGAQNLTVTGASNWTLGGGVMLLTPSAQMIGSSWKEIGASNDTVYGTKTASGNVNIAGAWLNVGVNMVNMSIAPAISFGYSGLKIDLCVFKLQNKGFNLVSGGPDVKQNQIFVFV